GSLFNLTLKEIMVTNNQIQNFLALKTLAIIGVSRNPKKFGNAIYSELRTKNYTVYPVNPNLNKYENAVCYPDLKSLPVKPDGLVIVTNKEKSLGIVKDAHSTGINNIWIVQTSGSKEAIEYCQNNSINVIYKQCIFMFLDVLPK
ncbi:MAG: CoA-binding protein, partial [Ignavibacteriae bacterium]|nr:CoA-binding protein [Ignavibacteriota bacterium]